MTEVILLIATLTGACTAFRIGWRVFGHPCRTTRHGKWDKHTGLCLRWEPDRIEHYDLLDLRETSMRKLERLEAEHRFDLERDCEEVWPGVWRLKYLLPDPPTAGRRPPAAENVKRTPPPKPPPRMRVTMKPRPRR